MGLRREKQSIEGGRIHPANPLVWSVWFFMRATRQQLDDIYLGNEAPNLEKLIRSDDPLLQEQSVMDERIRDTAHRALGEDCIGIYRNFHNGADARHVAQEASGELYSLAPHLDHIAYAFPLSSMVVGYFNVPSSGDLDFAQGCLERDFSGHKKLVSFSVSLSGDGGQGDEDKSGAHAMRAFFRLPGTLPARQSEQGFQLLVPDFLKAEVASSLASPASLDYRLLPFGNMEMRVDDKHLAPVASRGLNLEKILADVSGRSESVPRMKL